MKFYTPTKTLKARKAHRCTYCGQAIEIGMTYLTWASISIDGEWYTNKMHPECLDDAREWGHAGDFEYTLFDNERPTSTVPNTTQRYSHE